MSIDPDSKKWLENHFNGNVRFDELMSAHTSLKVGGPSDAYVEPESKEDLIKLVKWSNEKGLPYMIIGNGTNLLVRDNGLPGIVIALNRCLKKIFIAEKRKDIVTVIATAGAKLGALCSFALKKGLKGMNFALGIPGTIGGGIMMNAGTSYGSMQDVLTAITVLLPTGKINSVRKEKLDFSYRNLSWKTDDLKSDWNRPVIIEGCYSLFPSDPYKLKKEAETILKNRRKKQPVVKPSAGCFFKNPEFGKTAGELIDRAGLKGMKIGDAEVSKKHANFIINRKMATAADILELMTFIQNTVKKKFNIHLLPEVKIVGN